MQIKEILSQYRRDFRAIYECEHCGASHEGDGYDDAHLHRNVIPKMECKSCGKTAGDDYHPLGTRYPDGVTV